MSIYKPGYINADIGKVTDCNYLNSDFQNVVLSIRVIQIVTIFCNVTQSRFLTNVNDQLTYEIFHSGTANNFCLEF